MQEHKNIVEINDSLQAARHPEPGFGKVFSPNMLLARNEDGQWHEPYIRPFAKLGLAPTSSALHYGQSVFEGMKVFRAADGTPHLFRPQDHFLRMNRSARRLCMPEISERVFLGGITDLLRLDREWIPSAVDRSLYVRPLYFATDESLGLRVAENYLFVVMTGPVGEYHHGSVSVLLDRENARSFVGGTGDIKTAGNYAPTLRASQAAKRRGFDDILWVDSGTRSLVEECGTMNVFFVFDEVIVTPRLSGTILPGITRDSVLQLLAAAGRQVEERDVPVSELVARHEGGSLRECFGTGTAASITRISRIGYEGRDFLLPDSEDGSVAVHLRAVLTDVQHNGPSTPAGWLMPLA